MRAWPCAGKCSGFRSRNLVGLDKKAPLRSPIAKLDCQNINKHNIIRFGTPNTFANSLGYSALSHSYMSE